MEGEMCETIIVYHSNQIIGTHTWTEGFIRCLPPDKKLDDNKVMAECLYLVRHGHTEEAEELLEWWTARQ